MGAGDYKIQVNGRYHHSKNYQNKIATVIGFNLLRIRDVVVRKENKKIAKWFYSLHAKTSRLLWRIFFDQYYKNFVK